MVSMERAAEAAATFWGALRRRDLAGCVATLAPDVVRIGPREDEEDQIRGIAAYSEYLGSILATMPVYDNITHEVVARADGRRAYLHYTEIVGKAAGSTDTISVSGVIIFHFNDDGLIGLLDIYWRLPRQTVEWTKGVHLVEAAAALGG